MKRMQIAKVRYMWQEEGKRRRFDKWLSRVYDIELAFFNLLVWDLLMD